MSRSNKPWNLLIITADDLNADSLGWMGSTVGATPNIDAFAAECHQFRNCHTPVPICQPSRAVLMTGCWPHHNGAPSFGPVRDDVTTLTETMKRAGYFTAAINKTHHMMPRKKFDWDLMFDGSGKNPAALREHFEKCLTSSNNKPFFINANSTDPHGPFAINQDAVTGRKREREIVAPVEPFSERDVVIPSFLENLPEVRREVAQYFSVVRRFDQSFGELVDALRQSGRMENTIVVFVSDHGISMPFSKATLYRHATRTPVLVRVPSTSQPVVSEDMLSSIDLMPTILDLLGLPIPKSIDGKSWRPLFHGKARDDNHCVFTQIDAVKSGRKFPGRCVRTKSLAYIWNSWANGRTRFRIGTGSTRKRLSWKALLDASAQDSRLKGRVNHYLYRAPEEFYNDQSDPNERINLIDDPRCQSEIARLKALLQEHLDKTDDPLAARFRRAQKPAAKAVRRAQFKLTRKLLRRG